MRRPRHGPLPYLGALLTLYLLAPFVALAFVLRPGTARGLRSGQLLSALGVSASAATISCALIALTGIPLAYVLARRRSRWLGLVGLLVQLPLALPPLMSGILLLFLVGPYTFLGRLTGGRLTDTLAGIVLAQTFVASPFLVVAARSAFESVDASLEGVAATLGHRAWSRFVRVSLPLAWPGIRAGLLLAWLRAFGEFGATAIVAYHPYSLPVYTFVQFGSVGLDPTLPAVVIALIAALAVLGLSRRWPARARRPVPALPAPVPPAAPAGGRSELLSFSIAKRLGAFELRLAHRATSRHLALLGPSGAGKSLTVRVLAGLQALDRGEIRLGERALTTVPPESRPIGYMPQDYGLFPHLPVWAHVTFGRDVVPGRARYWVDRLGLTGLETRLPAELSGGQRQRVALARALSRHPSLLLLDEPFSGLDAPVREDLRRELRSLQREAGLATLVVTHDPTEAAFLADEVLVVSEGRLLQAGPVAEVFARPGSPEVARLLAIPNVFPGRVGSGGAIECGGIAIPVGDGELGSTRPGGRVIWCVRPEDLEVSGDGPLGGRILDVVELGSEREVLVALSAELSLRVRTTRGRELQPGVPCRLRIARGAIRVWEAGATDPTPAADDRRSPRPEPRTPDGDPGPSRPRRRAWPRPGRP